MTDNVIGRTGVARVGDNSNSLIECLLLQDFIAAREMAFPAKPNCQWWN